jgi:SAM-dependent methyltransferase
VNDDRVGDVYEGTAGDPQSQARTRARVHWMCAQVVGADVLDVGCSQGTVAILLGRDGKTVVGLDRETAALRDAHHRLDAEEASVRERVRFVEATASEIPFEVESFDTVVLGEVLEHQVLPHECLEEARRVLRPGGRCVITVPYGLLAFHDHKDPLYLRELFAMLEGRFEVDRIELIDRYLGLVCRPARPADERRSPPLDASLEIAEKRLALQDWRVADLERERRTSRERVRELQARIEAAAEAKTALGEELEGTRTALGDRQERFEAEVSGLRGRLAELEPLAGHRGQLARRRAEKLSEVKARERATRKRARRLKREVKRLRASRALRLARLAGALGRPRRRRGRARASKRAPTPTSGKVHERKAVSTPVAAPTAVAGDGADRVESARRVSVDREPERVRSALRAQPTDLLELEVAAIMDEMSAACFAPECRLRRVGSDDWRERLEERRPDLLFVESAWAGNTGSWQYQVASYTHPDSIGLPKLTALVEWCRAHGVPTVFWNKEDPVHFGRFKEAAGLFDHVFTTDASSVESYRELRPDGLGVVDILQFAAQPRIHNPVTLASPRRLVPCFAGTYYRDRHPARRRDVEMLLDAAMPFGLVIYDRTHGGASSEAFGFPERFLAHVEGGLSYEETLDAYKSFELFLNVNSVVDSPSMFSRRVFELLACDTPVVSTPSLGLDRTFGDLVTTVEDAEAATRAIEHLLSDGGRRRKLAAEGRRLVLRRHTYRHRLAHISEALGHRVDPGARERVGAIMLLDERHDEDELERSEIGVSGEVTLMSETLVGVVGDAVSADDVERRLPAGLRSNRLRVVAQDAGAPASDRIRDLARLATAPWLAVLDSAHGYRPHHLSDLTLAAGFASADVIGSALPGLTGLDSLPTEHLFVTAVHPHSAIARRELVAARGWPSTEADAVEVMGRWHREGVRLYAAESDGVELDDSAGPRMP